MAWFGASRHDSWAVIDVETTGLFPSVDRVIEVAVVTLDRACHVTDCWETLVDPGRDLGPTSIHGLTSRQVSGAPTFAEIAPELLWRLSGKALAAHNVRFDLGFLAAELGRLGLDWGPIEGACTMEMAYLAGARGRSLVDCCESLGIPLGRHHAAVHDARAAAGILVAALSRATVQSPPPAPDWPAPTCACRVRVRTDPPLPRVPSGTAALATRIGVPNTLPVSLGAGLAYLDLLDHVVEDRRITDEEVRALAGLAAQWGIGPEAAAAIHASYLSEVWRLARADGVVTAAELADIEILAELLGVCADPKAIAVTEIRTPPARSRRNELEGLAVCFTGESVCCLDGEHLERRDQEGLAMSAGLIVKSGVSCKLDLLVLADPDSMSGKARRARELGVRCMAEPVFWRALGLEVEVI
jgi:DNA polymerase III subunit epsilon